jgi:hypothetical protein
MPTDHHRGSSIGMRRPPRCFARAQSVSADLNYVESDAVLLALGMTAAAVGFLVSCLGWSV